MHIGQSGPGFWLKGLGQSPSLGLAVLATCDLEGGAGIQVCKPGPVRNSLLDFLKLKSVPRVWA